MGNNGKREDNVVCINKGAKKYFYCGGAILNPERNEGKHINAAESKTLSFYEQKLIAVTFLSWFHTIYDTMFVPGLCFLINNYTN